MNPLPVPSKTSLTTLAIGLTAFGALPLLILALALLLPLPMPIGSPSHAWLTQALIAYAAIILAFLGGIHWGLGLAEGRAMHLPYAVMAALLAWGASLLPWPHGVWALIAGFLLMLTADLRHRSLPHWYRRMRVVATMMVITPLAAAAILATNPTPATMKEASMAKNVLGTRLQLCGSNPRTGFYRNGLCETGPDDRGRHTVCAVVNEAFLEFTLQRGNDLITPRPDYNFPGLNPGDRWCLCALRWKEALDAGVAPPVVLEATHAASLEYVTLDDLKHHAWPGQAQE